MVVLSGLAGGVGSLLAGARALRNAARLNDLRALSAWSVLQPFVGATAALILLLVLDSEILVLPGVGDGESALVFGAYGFLAGFSEPFFLGVVNRIAGIGEQSSSPSTGQ